MWGQDDLGKTEIEKGTSSLRDPGGQQGVISKSGFY